MNCAAIIVRAQRDKNAGVGVPLLKKDGHSDHPFSSRRGDSNARPPRPERGALPTALLLEFSELRKKTSKSRKRLQRYYFFRIYANYSDKKYRNSCNLCVFVHCWLHFFPFYVACTTHYWSHFPPLFLSPNPYPTRILPCIVSQFFLDNL